MHSIYIQYNIQHMIEYNKNRLKFYNEVLPGSETGLYSQTF